jgi:hypothetical protein
MKSPHWCEALYRQSGDAIRKKKEVLYVYDYYQGWDADSLQGLGHWSTGMIRADLPKPSRRAD